MSSERDIEPEKLIQNVRKKSSPSAIETLVRPTAMLHRVREPTVFGCPLRLNYASHTGQKHL